MLGLQPAPQRLKLLLGHEVAPVLVGEPDEGRDEDGEDEAAVELEILLVGDFAEQLVEAHVVEEGRRVVGRLEVVLQVFDRDLALDPLGVQPLEDGAVIGPRGYEESEVLVAGLEVLFGLVLGALYRGEVCSGPDALFRLEAVWMVDEQGIWSPEHGILLFVSIVLLGHIEVVELPLHISEPLHARQQSPGPVLQDRHLHPLRIVLQVDVDLLGALLPRFDDHSQHVQSLDVVPAGRGEAVGDGIAHHWHPREDDVLVQPNWRMDGPEFLGEALSYGFVEIVIEQVSLGPELEIALQGVEEQHAAATVQQRADIQQDQAYLISWGVFLQSCDPPFRQDGADADHRVMHPKIEVQELSAARVILWRQDIIPISHSLTQDLPILLQLLQLGLYLLASRRLALNLLQFLYARREEDIGPGSVPLEDGRTGDEIRDRYLEGVVRVGLVPDVERAFLLAARFYLIDIVLVQGHGGPLLGPQHPLQGELHSRSDFADQLLQSRVELAEEEHFGQLVLVDGQKELQRTMELHPVDWPVVGMDHELQSFDELLPLRAIPNLPEKGQVGLLRVELVVDVLDVSHFWGVVPSQHAWLALVDYYVRPCLRKLKMNKGILFGRALALLAVRIEVDDFQVCIELWQSLLIILVVSDGGSVVGVVLVADLKVLLCCGGSGQFVPGIHIQTHYQCLVLVLEQETSVDRQINLNPKKTTSLPSP